MSVIIDETFLKDPALYLREECKKRGINLADLCTLAKVDRSTVERWKGKPPYTLQIMQRVQNELAAIPVTITAPEA